MNKDGGEKTKVIQLSTSFPSDGSWLKRKRRNQWKIAEFFTTPNSTNT